MIKQKKAFLKYRKIVKESELFDTKFYLKTYRDARQANETPLDHFIKYGLNEDRKPNEDFDPVWYREYYQDVKKDGISPFIHYCLFGKEEKRLSNSTMVGHLKTDYLKTDYLKKNSSLEKVKYVTAVVGIPRSGITLTTALLGNLKNSFAWFSPFSIPANQNISTFSNISQCIKFYEDNVEPINKDDYHMVISSSSADLEQLKMLFSSLKNFKEEGVQINIIWVVRDLRFTFSSLEDAKYKFWGAEKPDYTLQKLEEYIDFFEIGYTKIIENLFRLDGFLLSYASLIDKPLQTLNKVVSQINLPQVKAPEEIIYTDLKKLRIAGDPSFESYDSIVHNINHNREEEWKNDINIDIHALNEQKKLFFEEFIQIINLTNTHTLITFKELSHSLVKNKFDSEYYLKTYPDIKQAKMNPLQHYKIFGWEEKRNPIKSLHALTYEVDMKESNIECAPFVHYLLIGQYIESSTQHIVGSIDDLIIIDPLEYEITEDLLLEAPYYKNPKVSILIPAYNQQKYTMACIESIIQNTEGITYEIIVMDDKSPDHEAQEIESHLKNVKFIVNGVNYGFLRNCNKGAKFTIGEYILFLNNDTNVQPGWLSSLVELIESADDIGMVGSRLVYPTGEQQEAGGIVWNDASGWNFGRLDDPNKPEYNYVKESDYLTGAAMMIRTSLWEEIGGFDERYVPAYYEDSDLAFEVRNHGYRAMYQPKSIVIHFEGISNGTDLGSGIKQYQVVNKEKFLDKWQNVLKTEHFPNAQDVFLARDRSKNKKHILIIDHYVPHFDQDAGSRTMWQYLLLFKDLGYQVTFVGDNFYKHEPYTSMLENSGIEVLYGEYYANHFDSWLDLNGKYFDFVYLLRPHIAIKYIDKMKKYTEATIFYNGTDFHFLRMQREYDITQDPQLLENLQNTKKDEMHLFEKSDCVLTISEYEKDYFNEKFSPWNVELIPTYIYNEELPLSHNSFINRDGLLFVGGFVHKPNLEGVKWFLNEIWPLIIKEIPHIKFYIVGSHMPDELKNLKSESIIPKGFVSDEELALLYENTKVVVAPLTFGAGVKGKIIEAICNGVPTVTTSVGAEGIIDAISVLSIADKPDKFATNIIKLYNDSKQWKNMREKQSLYAQKHFNLKNVKTYIDDVFSKDYK